MPRRERKIQAEATADGFGARVRLVLAGLAQEQERRGIKRHARGAQFSDSWLHGELKKAGVRKIRTLPTVLDVLNDRKPPSLPFIEAVSRILGLEVEWLVNGTGPRMTIHREFLVEDEQSEIDALTLQDRKRHIAALAGVDFGSDGMQDQRKEAVLRLALRLELAGGPIRTDPDARPILLQRAARWLVSAEKAFDKAVTVSEGPPLPRVKQTLYHFGYMTRPNETAARYLAYLDDLLAIFARQVDGAPPVVARRVNRSTTV